MAGTTGRAMNLVEARAAARHQLGDASALVRPAPMIELGRRETEGKGFFEAIAAMTVKGFPIPELILFGFSELLGFTPDGPGEKVRWTIAFEFRGVGFIYELRKLGLRLLIEESSIDSPIVKEVLGRTRALTDIVECHLTTEVLPKQLVAGAIVVSNSFSFLSKRCLFLRKEAFAAYGRPPPPPEKVLGQGFTATVSHAGVPTFEGGSLAAAAVDAYFSRLELLFVIASAFHPNALGGEGVAVFLNKKWADRAISLLDLQDASVKKLYDRLSAVRENWRNPLAHGTFQSGGASLYVQVPGIGALPARLRRTPAGVQAGFQLSSESFESICGLFDEFDANLAQGPLRFGLRWAESGLDIAFDSDSLAQYRAAMVSDEEFEEFLDGTARATDRHDNMDY